MATYTAKDVSELRQRTQAGMMDCKKALEESQGDMEAAVEWLRKKGISRGESRAGRAASEGKIVARVAPDGATGALVELNSETDFVARNEAFGQTVEKIADTLLASGAIIVPRRYARFGGAGSVGAYVHHNGKVGTLVEVAGLSGEAGQQLARTVAQHNTAGVATVPPARARGDRAGGP